MVAHDPAPFDENPYSAPASEGGVPVASFDMSGGTPFRGELTLDDVARAERLHARALAISPVKAIIIFGCAAAPAFGGVLTGMLPIEGLFIVGFVAVGLVLTQLWQLNRRVAIRVPAGPYAGAAARLGLRFESSRWTCQVRWSEVPGYVADEEMVVFYLGQGPVAVAKRSFETELAWAQFCETVLRSGVRPRA
jgi:hypothetical protein